MLFSWKLFVAFTSLQLYCVSAYNVVNFGARGDGITDSTSAFLQTWSAACNSVTPASVSVPQGTFLVKFMHFAGPCKNKILFEISGTLIAPADYKSIGSSDFWILFHQVSGLTLTGGTIDARGSKLWSCKKTRGGCPMGVRSLCFEWCSNVLVSGLQALNAQGKHITINHSRNIKFQNMKVIAPSTSPNTDGIYVASSMGVTISRSTIKTGDDCISIGPGSMNVYMELIGCGPGHGISVGSLGISLTEDGVQNVTVTNSIFTKTQNGVRIKTWARASNGFANNLVFKNLVMRNVANPMIIDQNYCPGSNCLNQNSGVKVSQVTFRNIKGSSSTQAAMTFRCSSTNPCRGISVQDIRLTYVDTKRRPALSFCQNAVGSQSGAVFPKSCL